MAEMTVRATCTIFYRRGSSWARAVPTRRLRSPTLATEGASPRGRNVVSQHVALIQAEVADGR